MCDVGTTNVSTKISHLISLFGFAKDRYLEIGIKYMTGWGLNELANRSSE